MATIRPRKRASGTVYAVLFRIGTGDGAIQTSRTFNTEPQAKKFKALITAVGADKACQMLDEQSDVARGAITVQQLWDLWITAKDPDITQQTRDDYRGHWRNWMANTFAHRVADAIDEMDVQNWVDWMKPRLSPKSVADRHAILFQMYDWGSSRKRRHVAVNPCTETELPPRKPSQIRGLRLSELGRLLAAGETTAEQDAADMVAFLAGTGWRPSEGFGLLAEAVELWDDGRVFVTMEGVIREREGRVDGAKTDASLGRRLEVLGVGADAVRRRMTGLKPKDYVFTFTPKTHIHAGKQTPWNGKAFREWRWPILVEAAGLTSRGPTPYWLRHTHVMVCIAAGMDLPEIQRRLGHKSIKTTIDIYNRLREDIPDAVLQAAHRILQPTPAA